MYISSNIWQLVHILHYAYSFSVPVDLQGFIPFNLHLSFCIKSLEWIVTGVANPMGSNTLDDS